MSKHNVHPDHYKTAGRERQGKALGQDISRKALIYRIEKYGIRKGTAEEEESERS